MSSGDFTTYLRGKSQERDGPDEKFMEDGFQRWAESDAPSRVGGAHKEDHDRALPRSRMRRGRGVDVYDSDSDDTSTSGEEMSGGRRAHRSGVRAQAPVSRKYDSTGRDESGEDDSDADNDSGSDSDTRSTPDSGGRRRRHRGGESGMNMAYNPKFKMLFNKYLNQGMSKMEASQKAINDMTSQQRNTSDTSQQRNASGKYGSDSDDSYSSGSSREMGMGRRRRHRGGAFTGNLSELTTGPVKDRIDNAFDLWNNYAPPGGYTSSFPGNVFQGKSLKNFSSIPQKVKDMVAKIEEVWKKLKTGAAALKQLANTNGFPAALKDAVVPQLTAVGFGRHQAKKYGKKMLKQVFTLLRHGGDKFDDKLNSLGVKGAYDTAKSLAKDIGSKFDGVVRPVYNAAAYVRDNADTINSAIDAVPGVSAQTKTSVKGVVSGIKNSGLGRKGKRAPSKRNMLVSKLMKEHGMSLPEASRKASQMMKGGEGL